MDKKKTIQMVMGVIAFLILGCVYLVRNTSPESQTVVTEEFSDAAPANDREKGLQETAKAVSSSAATRIYIHICGEVRKPGVYTFAKEPRVVDVIEKAGGFTKRARQDCVNMAEAVADGTQLVIASKERTRGAGNAQKEQDKGDSNKININSASKEELMTLSGIGESKATQILSYRESNGRFLKIEDIMKISGIKEGVFSKIKDYITV